MLIAIAAPAFRPELTAEWEEHKWMWQHHNRQGMKTRASLAMKNFVWEEIRLCYKVRSNR
ncbi:hypothetical protein AN963_07290 [Brevibacillus choshinensis]|uniref:Uncharacterized protein n=1 Tax=Brevibacillus choshinensis TaxID=54911 RepID=A0ABR5NDA3_BRECH|nr:hypothetical protein AN963_07290 [Brevibacillus choshinensis]